MTHEYKPECQCYRCKGIRNAPRVFPERVRAMQRLARKRNSKTRRMSSTRDTSTAAPKIGMTANHRVETTDMQLIKTFRKHGCTLRMWDLNTRNSLGKNQLGYELKSGRRVIFSGEDFACSPLCAIDSIECVAALLGFLTLKRVRPKLIFQGQLFAAEVL